MNQVAGVRGPPQAQALIRLPQSKSGLESIVEAAVKHECFFNKRTLLNIERMRAFHIYLLYFAFGLRLLFFSPLIY